MRDVVRTAVSEWQELIKPKNLERLKELLPPAVLAGLDSEETEALLSGLPQIGALRDREPGGLRIVSVGYHIHLQGRDKDCPYPVDFFVRAGGILSAVNLVLRISPKRSRENLFAGRAVGSDFDLLDALRELDQHGLGPRDLELVQQRMYRPCVPNKFHWSTPGGVQQPGEDARLCGLQELAEEAQGLTVIASRVLLRNREYQGGNIPEFHSVTGVLCVGEPVIGERATREGISEYTFIPLLAAEDWFDVQCAVDPSDPACNLPGGKTEHALLKLFRLCARAGIW